MTTYPNNRVNFSLRPQYSIDVAITTNYVAGGTQVFIGNQAVKHTEVNNGPNSSGSPRSYSTPNGRSVSVSGSLAQSGSDSGWAFSFTFPGVPQYQNIWGASGGFTRFYPDSVSIGTINISASHSLLGEASNSVSGIKHVFRTTFDANGGTVGTSSIDEDSGNSIFLPAPTRSGYNFLGWTSGGTNYGTGAYTVNATRTLTASWEVSTPAPVFTDPLDIFSTVRVGESWSDLMSASNTYAALGLSGTSYEFISGPAGMGISVSGNNCFLVGTISAQPSTTYSIVIRAYGPGGSADTTATVTLKQALPVFTDTSLGNGRVGTQYSSSTSNTSISATYATSWDITNLPQGMSYTFSGDTATLTGTPTIVNDHTIYAVPYNSDNEAGPTGFISLSILPRIPEWVKQTLNTSARVGTQYSDTLSANYVFSWNQDSLASRNVSFSAFSNTIGLAVATISGVPDSFGPISFSVTPFNSASETPGARSFTINVLDAFLVWQSQVLASSIATQGEAYSDGVSIASGPTVTYSIVSGGLPPGLELSSTTGLITGTPTDVDSYDFSITATNGSGETIEPVDLTITVVSAGGYVQVKTLSGWQNAVVYVKTAGGWVEGSVNTKSPTGWGPSFSS